jgi:hypothetical protein
MWILTRQRIIISELSGLLLTSDLPTAMIIAKFIGFTKI